MVELPAELNPKTVTTVWSHDLDQYIEKHFGRPWSLGQNDPEGAGQDTLTAFEVYPDPESTMPVQAWLDSPPAKIPGRLNQEGVAESVDIYTADILNELCNRGLLPEGDLTVHIWW